MKKLLEISPIYFILLGLITLIWLFFLLPNIRYSCNLGDSLNITFIEIILRIVIGIIGYKVMNGGMIKKTALIMYLICLLLLFFLFYFIFLC